MKTVRPDANGLVAVVTTIQEPTASVRELCRRLAEHGTPLVAVGDKKGPRAFDAAGATMLTLAEQKQLPFELAAILPEGHYARKNLGYLIAFQSGATHVYETDDDNAPEAGFRDRARTIEAAAAPAAPGWLNVYASFTSALVWPRGFPLELIRAASTRWSADAAPLRKVDAPIQQGLANGAPDVDAVWRLALDADLRFDDGPSVLLPRGVWCPFNSQSTWWWPEAYPLMYLPSHCSFRMTDIWRSFVAQRCLWELGHGVVFHAAEVVQLRNEHRLIRDFADEIPGYLHNAAMIEALAALPLEPAPDAVAANLVRCYELLVERGWVGADELPLVRAWTHDCARALGAR